MPFFGLELVKRSVLVKLFMHLNPTFYWFIKNQCQVVFGQNLKIQATAVSQLRWNRFSPTIPVTNKTLLHRIRRQRLNWINDNVVSKIENLRNFFIPWHHLLFSSDFCLHSGRIRSSAAFSVAKKWSSALFAFNFWCRKADFYRSVFHK